MCPQGGAANQLFRPEARQILGVTKVTMESARLLCVWSSLLQRNIPSGASGAQIWNKTNRDLADKQCDGWIKLLFCFVLIISHGSDSPTRLDHFQPASANVSRHSLGLLSAGVTLSCALVPRNACTPGELATGEHRENNDLKIKLITLSLYI